MKRVVRASKVRVYDARTGNLKRIEHANGKTMNRR